MKSVEKQVGESVYNSWPHGAVLAIEQLESQMQEIKFKILDAQRTGNGKYLDQAVKMIAEE